MSKKKILIFGASGFAGSNFVSDYAHKYDFFIHSRKKKLKKNRKFVYLSFKIENKILDKFLKKNKINYIVNFLGYTSVEKCEIYKKRAYDANCKKVEIISNFCNANNISLIHISTDHIFDKKINFKSNENSKFRIKNYYAKTKYLAEKKIILSGCNYIIFRCSFFGWSPKNRKNTFLEEIYFSKNKKMNLWKDIYSTPIYVKILTNIIDKLIQKGFKKNIFNIGSNQIVSKYELAEKFIKVFNIKNYQLKKIQYKDTNLVNRPKNMSLENKKICKVFPSLGKKLNINHMLKLMLKDKNKIL